MNCPDSECSREKMPEKRRSKEEFETFLKSLFDRDSPTVKYQNPDVWRIPPQQKWKKRSRQ
jgi:hypothetical protein